MSSNFRFMMYRHNYEILRAMYLVVCRDAVFSCLSRRQTFSPEDCKVVVLHLYIIIEIYSHVLSI